MHAFVSMAAVAAAVGFAFGETVARFFVGALLACGAVVVLFAVSIVILDMNRQPRAIGTVHMGSSR